MVNEVILPTFERVRLVSTPKNTSLTLIQATRDDMDAREIESLSMISRGFEELRDVNPELAYNVMLDILSGINEYVISPSSFPTSTPLLSLTVLLDSMPIADCPVRNEQIRQHVQTARGLFPHKRIIRKSEMTSKGLIVTEEEEVSGLPSTSEPVPVVPEEVPARKSPIAELLYMRWLEGLKLKWPSLLSS